MFPVIGPLVRPGRASRAKPVFFGFIFGPRGRLTRDFLLDSAADDLVVPETWAGPLGIDLSHCPTAGAHGWGSNIPVSIRIARVILEFSDGAETCRWRTEVGFAPMRDRYGLFGVAGGLEYFRTTLDFERREIELIPQPTLPATTDAVP